MLERLPDPEAAQRWCETVRRSGKTLGFVPTMGALHEGHLALVERAVAECDACCVSVYVNPLQFDEASDFENYPRDFEDDCRMLESRGCAMAFTGTLAGFFPGKLDADGRLASDELLDPGPRARGLEGEYRTGHFAGVATIVRRLFEVTRPARAYFGQKDFQQTLVVADVATALGYPEVVVCPTVREPSGLAMSSRNQRLRDHEREEALVLSRALQCAREAWQSGERDAAELSAILRAVFEEAKRPFEYAAIRDPERWTAEDPEGRLERAVALVAARVGCVRLIDNMLLSAGATP